MTKDNHSKFHNLNAFCGNAGPEEMSHFNDLINKLSDSELKELTKRVGVKFMTEPEERETYEQVIDEADREVFYREYKNIMETRK